MNSFFIQTTAVSSSTNKNYQPSQSSSKQLQPMPSNYRSSMSSHSDIFMKADEQKINFGKNENAIKRKQETGLIPRNCVSFNLL